MEEEMRRLMTVGALLAALMVAACGSTDLGGAPNVKGLALPEAKQQLKTAGFSTSVKDDSLFGVVIESHFTVCKQGTPNSKLVPLKVSNQPYTAHCSPPVPCAPRPRPTL